MRISAKFWIFILIAAFSQSFKVVAEEEGISNPSSYFLGQDTVFTTSFASESDLTFFIAKEFSLEESIVPGDLKKIDSIHQVLNETKSLVIPKSDLLKFLGFSVTTPVPKIVISQTIALEPKKKTQDVVLDVNKGDSFSMIYKLEGGFLNNIGAAAYIEVLLNQVRVVRSLTSKRGKVVKLDFVAQESGEVKISFRNIGFLKEQGNLEVFVTPKKEFIELKQIRIPVQKKETVNAVVGDTLYQRIIDETVLLNHRANLRGSSIYQKELEFSSDQELLGFAFFYYPIKDKDNLQVFRRESYREDPLEDFALKELQGKSFTYLPEYSILSLDFSLQDSNRNSFWANGNSLQSRDWQVSPNSKKNYGFFFLSEPAGEKEIQFKFSNLSDLYEVEIGLQLIALSIKKFSIKQEVENTGYEEYIQLTLR